MSTAHGPQGPGGEDQAGQGQWGQQPPGGQWAQPGQWAPPGPASPTTSAPQWGQQAPPPAGQQWTPPQTPGHQWGQPSQPGQWSQPGQPQQPGQWGPPQQPGQWGQQQPWQGPGYGMAPEVPRPKSIDLAVLLMRIGAGLAFLAIPLAFILRGDIDQAVRDEMARQQSTAPKGTKPLPPELLDTFINAGLVVAAVGGLIGVGLWLWMAWANGQGKKWARVTATVFFGISVLNLVQALVNPLRGPGFSVALQVISLLVGAAAVFFLWTKESTAFYESRSRRY